MLLQLSHFPPLYLPPPCTTPPTSIPLTPLSSCSWIIHISSLAYPFPILFLTSPCLFLTYHLCFVFPVPFLPFFPLHLPTDNPPCDLHSCDSAPVLLVCLVLAFFFFFLGSVVDICEFVVILQFVFFIFFFFLDKYL